LLLKDEPVADLIAHAIRRRVCVTATYNRAHATLAPHSLFERHGDLYLRAVTLDYDGRKPKEAKLGTFKLAGLYQVAVTRKLFSPKAVFAGLDLPQEVREPAPAGAE
jgi:hypothetical protein